MKRILYAGGSFVTGDHITDAVLDYAAELANAGRAARLEVPALNIDLQHERVSLVVGPSSQLFAEPVSVGQELEDASFTQELQRKTQVLQVKSGTGDAGDAEAFSVS